MKLQLQLKDLFVGKLDAKNEPASSDKDKERFIDGFLLPDNIIPKDFFLGKRYYIVGQKGTGKTALLKYIQFETERIRKGHSVMVLFKSDFTEEDKSAFSRAATCFIDGDTTNDYRDFTNVWLWYFHRLIVNQINEDNLDGTIFKDDDNWKKYQTCVNAAKIGDEKSGIMKLLPKLKRGNIDVNGSLGVVSSKLGLEFEWADEAKTSVKFSDIVKQVNNLYQKLSCAYKATPLYLFVDELELSFDQNKQYKNDIKMIRDLIIAIDKINRVSRELNFPIYIITSIRSEVLTAIEISGKEINKIVSDFGVSLKWAQRGDDSKQHPLINIITKKIQTSYKAYNTDVISEDEVWDTFFPTRIGEKSIYEYILNKTWYRPRDIVRLLSIAQQQYPNNYSFSQNVLESINKEYSKDCWNEQIEELRAIYNEQDLLGVKRILLGLKCPFTINSIESVIESKRRIYDDVDKLLKKYKLADILSNLYRVGIIGNTGNRIMRFSFRGDDELIVENLMTIHQAFWNYLSLQKSQLM